MAPFVAIQWHQGRYNLAPILVHSSPAQQCFTQGISFSEGCARRDARWIIFCVRDKKELRLDGRGHGRIDDAGATLDPRDRQNPRSRARHNRRCGRNPRSEERQNRRRGRNIGPSPSAGSTVEGTAESMTRAQHRTLAIGRIHGRGQGRIDDAAAIHGQGQGRIDDAGATLDPRHRLVGTDSGLDP